MPVGQAGNQVGEAFWKMIIAEHGLDEQGAGVYFTEVESSKGHKYVPRSIQIDLEAGVCNRLRGGSLGELFRPDTYIHGQSGAGNNWAKGCVLKPSWFRTLSEGKQNRVMLYRASRSSIRSAVVPEFPDRMLATFSIIPSPKVSETIVEPYNAMLSMHQLVDNGDLTICVDNEALYDISTVVMKNPSPTFENLNDLIARVMCGVSTSLRFPGQLNGFVIVFRFLMISPLQARNRDLRKLGMNLVPFPRLRAVLQPQVEGLPGHLDS
ncbi:hypothetical protein D9615_005725 [Tricholomella constricta]|uniref:Tubulin/FtsZ GTPase domain-containing protein n=1 Tax=Tricholomella constricta TaxID=117010 RepID=A0A8H5HAL0_9AGAR|nr:hypothetical protein D9615_005725 [Tricholomella constricta]